MDRRYVLWVMVVIFFGNGIVAGIAQDSQQVSSPEQLSCAELSERHNEILSQGPSHQNYSAVLQCLDDQWEILLPERPRTTLSEFLNDSGRTVIAERYTFPWLNFDGI